MNTTKVKVDRKKTQREGAGHRQELRAQGLNPPVRHIYLGSHEQERPETRLTR